MAVLLENKPIYESNAGQRWAENFSAQLGILVRPSEHGEKSHAKPRNQDRDTDSLGAPTGEVRGLYPTDFAHHARISFLLPNDEKPAQTSAQVGT